MGTASPFANGFVGLDDT